MAMDPMQRLLLEVTYEAFENSGLPLEKVSGSQTSCFVGCFTKDYEEMQRRDMELAPKYQATGATQTMLSNRLSYFFNLKGQSTTLDTACSSGLVAVHLACQSLQTGESSMAVVGGSNLILSPDIQIVMSGMHFLSPDSISYAFDERANGYARGEGVGAIILKPLHLALRDNDPIRAIIRGSAASSDGRTPGITLPSKESQIDLIQSAYRAAGCDLSKTGYFEAHGTGTAAGDPLETGAIGEVFAAHRPSTRDGEVIPLSIGSLKTNMGHLEGASGIAGLIKAILSVEQGIIAPNIWFQKGNPAIDFDGWRIKVPTESMPWPLEGTRRASVNSFGYGGTNAHVIVDDARQYLNRTSTPNGHSRHNSGVVKLLDQSHLDPAPRPRVFLLSAHDEQALIRMSKKLAEYLQSMSTSQKERLIDSLAYTLCERRSRFSHVYTIVATNTSDLEYGLDNVSSTSVSQSDPPWVSYIFTGQGAQWWRMGRELLQYPVFKDSLRRCEAALIDLGVDWSLMEELLRDKADSRVDEAIIGQPICTALQISLVDLLASWNIHPHSVIGHSSGEIAAAYAIGALSATSAMAVAFFRGLLASRAKGLGYVGSMMAAGLSEDDANDEIARLNTGFGKVAIACINSPRSVTFSGDTPAIERLHSRLVANGVFARILRVDTAYHSYHMQAISEEYLDRLRRAHVTALEPKQRIPMFSSVTEQTIEWNQLGPEYWVKNLVSCVRFSGAIEKLSLSMTRSIPHAAKILLEIGPHSLFKLPVQEALDTTFGDRLPSIEYTSVLIRGQRADISALQVAAQLFAAGYPVDIHTANFPIKQRYPLSVLTDLPQYPWNHSRSYWYESRFNRDYRFRKFPRTDILGAPSYDWNPIEPRFRNFLRLREQPWLQDHVVQGNVLFPACGYICMGIEACRQMSMIAPLVFLPRTSEDETRYRFRDVHISRALLIPDTDEGVETSFSMRPWSRDSTPTLEKWHEFRVYSFTNDDGWAENCRGLISVIDEPDGRVECSRNYSEQWKAVRAKSTSALDVQTFYADMNAIGLTYGPLFQGIEDLAADPAIPGQAAGVIEVTDTGSANPKQFEHDRLLHPATVDSFLQLSLAALSGAGPQKLKIAMVPTFIKEVTVCSDLTAEAGKCLHVLAHTEKQGTGEASTDICALDPTTVKPVVLMNGIQLVAINAEETPTESNSSILKSCFKPVWEPDVDLINRRDLDCELQAASRLTLRVKNTREMELLAYSFIDQALKEVEDYEIAAMLPHHKKFYRSLCRLRDAVVAKTHPQQNEEWQRICDSDVAAKLEAMAQEYRSNPTAYDGKLLVRVGEVLLLILRQQVEPLALMVQDNLLEDYYAATIGAQSIQVQVMRYVTILSHKCPDLDYLEIGAGTGSATLSILQGLSGHHELHKYPRLKSYTYTDISTYFFQRAAERFEDFVDFMTFRKLDIEKDPGTQEFKDASYDVIIAANVLHATSDINRTMAHVRKLLRPGGKLILIELTNRPLAASIIFGTLPGWWNASEEWRTDGPLLTESQWEDVLRKNGFSSLQASSPDTPNPLEENVRLMVATAVPPVQANLCNGLSTISKSRHILILCRDCTVHNNQLEVANALKMLMDKAGLYSQVVSFSHLPSQDVTGAICISLAELNEPMFVDVSASDLRIIQRIAENSKGLIWVTRGASVKIEQPEMAVFSGLARTLRAEHQGFSCVTLGLDAEENLSNDKLANLLFRLYEKRFPPGMNSDTMDSEFVEQGGVLYIKRVVEDERLNQSLAARSMSDASSSPQLEAPVQQGCPLELRACSDNPSKSAVFEEDLTLYQPLRSTDVEIEVHATNLDENHALGVNGDLSANSICLECAGIVTKVGGDVSHLSVGDRVAFWYQGALTTHMRCVAACARKIQDSMSFEVAARLPLAYTAAYYALVHVARLTHGETILVNEPTSAVGQAIVRLASNLKAQIFVTSRSEEERAHLAAAYGLDYDHTLSSLDCKSVVALQQFTNGHGVDVAINASSSQASQTLFSCIASFGRFVGLQTGGLQEESQPELIPIGRSISFTFVDMNMLFAQKSKLAGKVFGEVMDLILDGQLTEILPTILKPWPKQAEVMDPLKNEDNVGKLGMDFMPAGLVSVPQEPSRRTQLREDASYLLAGGLGGLGRSIARWMADNGAKNLIFASRSGTSSESASDFIAELHALGVHTAVLTCDISDSTKLSTALTSTLVTFPPIRGIVQAAMSLNDSSFANMTHEQWTDAIRPKIHGSRNLHKETLNQPLDFFILLSSLHGFIGNPGQANYVAGCTYQVALAQYRNRLGLPAVAIDLGVIDEAGYVVETCANVNKKIVLQTFQHIREADMLGLIELAIHEPFMGHMVTGLNGSFDERPFFARDPVMGHLDYLRPHLQRPSIDPHTVEGPTDKTSLYDLLNNASSEDTIAASIQFALVQKLSRSLMMNPSDIDVSKSLKVYGADSLVAVELRNWVQHETKVTISVFEILQAHAISALVEKIAERYRNIANV